MRLYCVANVDWEDCGASERKTLLLAQVLVVIKSSLPISSGSAPAPSKNSACWITAAADSSSAL